jgi:hypothetical protein
MSAHVTSRSKLLGFYIQFKGVVWAVLGFALWWVAPGAPELGGESSLRLFAYYLMVFAVPGVLLWTVGVLVRYRHSTGWYLGVIYLIGLVVFKVGGGIAELPVEAWYWASRRVPPEFLTGLKVFGFLAAVIFATDLASLLSFLSPRGRECWGIGSMAGRDRFKRDRREHDV